MNFRRFAACSCVAVIVACGDDDGAPTDGSVRDGRVTTDGAVANDAPSDAGPDGPPSKSCLDVDCRPGTCVEVSGIPGCECNLGWESKGFSCAPLPGWFELDGSASPGVGSAPIDQYVVAFDLGGTPHLVWQRTDPPAVSTLTVNARRFADGAWQDLLPLASTLRPSPHELGAAFTDSSELVVMLAQANPDPPTVHNGFRIERWDGTTWSLHAESRAMGLALTVSDVPLVATYASSTNSAIVTRFEPATVALPPVANVRETDLELELSATRRPVVVGRTTDAPSAIAVTLYDGTDWAPLPDLPSTGLLRGAVMEGDSPIVLLLDGEVHRYRSSWEALPAAYSDAEARCPSLARFDDGRLVVAWEQGPDPGEIYVRVFDGTTWSEITGSATAGGISSTSTASQCPALAIFGDLVCVAWEEDFARVALRCAAIEP